MSHAEVRISQIMLDGGTQARARVDFRYVARLARAMAEGGTVEPVVLFFDGAHYWIGDGYHRARAAADAGLAAIAADVRDGDRRAALLFGLVAAAGAESTRNAADRRRAVALVLADAEWSRWSNQQIAETLFVTPQLVARLRNAQTETPPPPQPLVLADEAELSSAERCLLLDPYIASPETIAAAIERLKAHYRRKTGREYGDGMTR